MDNIVQLIIAVIGSSAITSLLLLGSKKRTSDTQSYKLLIDDLNARMKEALSRMRTLEDELNRITDENRTLRQENADLRTENEKLRAEIDRLKTQNT
jgi:FtsZ-binding cell division protein ZapB